MPEKIELSIPKSPKVGQALSSDLFIEELEESVDCPKIGTFWNRAPLTDLVYKLIEFVDYF